MKSLEAAAHALPRRFGPSARHRHPNPPANFGATVCQLLIAL